MPCDEISAEWGAQRIKGLSIGKALLHALQKPFRQRRLRSAQKSRDLASSSSFLYPKFGPGQMWERGRAQLRERGGAHRSDGAGRRASSTGDEPRHRACARATPDRRRAALRRRLVLLDDAGARAGAGAATPAPPPDVARDRRRPRIPRLHHRRPAATASCCATGAAAAPTSLVPDNWIYIQEPDVQGRPAADLQQLEPVHGAPTPSTVWVGLEYFCNEGDDALDDAGRRRCSELGVARAARSIDIADAGRRARRAP